jgi:hypothetical protein
MPDMINPQKGIDIMNNTSIINRILFAVTIFQHTMVDCDNQSCIKLTKNLVFHDRSKHIDMKYHYIQDLVQRKTVKLQYIATSEQVANILTKPLTLRQFVQLRGKISMAENDSLAERVLNLAALTVILQ